MESIQCLFEVFETYFCNFLLLLLFGTHLYFTFRLKIQKKIFEGIRLSFSGEGSGYSALATALAATIGTGNIIGVSTAIAVGGPGAVFWCWITGFLGITTCYAECFLSVKYKSRTKDGTACGGPMYVIEKGLGKKKMAAAFALLTVFVSFGMGSSVQAHSIQAAVKEHMPVSPHLIGIVAGVLVGIVIVGGSRQIAKICTWLVPVMSILYLGGCVYIIFKNYDVLGEVIVLILKSALSPRAAAGGILGRGIMAGIRTGIARGLFTNEAGLGSIPMAAASSKEKDPVRQGLISMTGPFWDTVVMCAVTGIAILCSVVKSPELYQNIRADRMCFVAFGGLPMAGELILSVSLVLFAFATIIGWNVYGISAVRYLWGESAISVYQVVYLLFVYFGAVLPLHFVWGMSDVLNLLMAVPNLFCLWKMRKEICVGRQV